MDRDLNDCITHPVFKSLSNYPIITISEGMDIAIGDKDLLIVMLIKDQNQNYNLLEIDVENCCQQLELCGLFKPIYPGYTRISSLNAGIDAWELSLAVLGNITNIVNAGRPRFLTFVPREMTNAENLLIIGFRSGYCGLYKLDSITSQYSLITDVVALLQRHFYVLNKVSSIGKSGSYLNESSENSYLIIEDIKFSGYSLDLRNNCEENPHSFYETENAHDIHHFSELKFVLGCVFLRKTSYIEDCVETSYIVLFVRFAQDSIDILGKMYVEPQLLHQSSNMTKCLFEQIDSFNYVAYCCYCDTSMDLVYFTLNNISSDEGNTIFTIAIQPNTYSTGEIKHLVHLNNKHNEQNYNCTTIIVQSFNVTFVEWSLGRNARVHSNLNFIIKNVKNLNVDGLTGIKSFLKMTNQKFLYQLEQGGLFCIEAPTIDEINVKILRLNTNYNLMYLDKSPLGCFSLLSITFLLPKRHVEDLIEFIPNLELNIDDCLVLLMSAQFCLNEFKKFINCLRQNKSSIEKCENLISTLPNHIQKLREECFAIAQLCTLSQIDEYLETLRLISVGNTLVANSNSSDNYKLIHRIELRLCMMMCMHEKIPLMKDFLKYLQQLYHNVIANSKTSDTILRSVSLFKSFLHSLVEPPEELQDCQTIPNWKICEYCIKTECSLNRFDYNEKGLIPLSERTWPIQSDYECDICTEKICLTNLHYAYCINGHRVKRCQLSYQMILPEEFYLECINCRMPFSNQMKHWIAPNYNCLVCIYCLSMLEYRRLSS